MKKVKVALAILCFLTMSCSNTNFSKITESFFGENIIDTTSEQKLISKLKSYNLEAKIITNKGDINLYLYPEATPKTVANFVYLTKKDFYKDIVFNNVDINNVIQSGDKKGDGLGTAGYYIQDEKSSFNDLGFDTNGVIAMAKMQGEPNTASSQFFITLREKPEFNGRYTIFGTIKSKEDLRVAKSIRQGDYIKNIEITGKNVNTFLDNFKEDVQKWDSKFMTK